MAIAERHAFSFEPSDFSVSGDMEKVSKTGGGPSYGEAYGTASHIQGLSTKNINDTARGLGTYTPWSKLGTSGGPAQGG